MTNNQDVPDPLRAPRLPKSSEDEAGDVTVAAGSRDAEPDALEIPERLPILPIRDTAAFPGTIMPLEVSREKSKRVLDLALAGTRMIAAVAQRTTETEDPKLEDLYRVGTACVILKMLRLADGTESIVIHGLRRVGIESVTSEKSGSSANSGIAKTAPAARIQSSEGP